MSDSPPTPDDLLVSAVLDGIASPDEVQRVASDPRLAARLAEFRAVMAAVGGPVPLVDTAVREAHLARALAEGVATTAAPPPPPPPPPLVDLAAARSRRDRPRSTTIVSVAAAIILVVAAGAFLVRLGGSVESGDDSASSAGETRESTADDSDGADGAADAEEGSGGSEAFSPDNAETSPASPPSTSAADAPEAGVDASLPDLGTFARAEGLASRVRGELILEPSPADLSATQAFADADTCADDFGVEVALLGRATLDGEEGLVYVESVDRSSRRLWLVDPGTVGADDACREITPVQTL